MFLVTFVELLTQALIVAIILRAVLSWFVPQGDHPVVRILRDVTDPLIVPLRRVVPTIGMLDLSPFVAIILLNVVRWIVTQTLSAPVG
ncbi:MAG: hypothetical protein CL878_00685 [Dehalococcoidia bacterium]|nr:hypothetical protein [Dehalococcoidia bacterium]